jgi:alpha-L-fucosidase
MAVCTFPVSAQHVLPEDNKAPVQTPEPLKLVLPTPQQVLWQDMEQTMFVHFGPSTWQGREYDNLKTPLSEIHPSKLDVNQWIDAAESFDAKMILFVAKHVGGFCWWQTETTEYSIKNTPYKNGKGDVLDELAKACFARGMKLGIYIYPGDETWGAYNGGGGRTRDPKKQEAYSQVLRKQWEEVLSRYGNFVTEIWFDGSVIIPLEDVVRKYAPSSIVLQGPFADIRWVGNERGICPYPNWYTVNESDAKSGTATAKHSTLDGDRWMPVEVDVPLKNHHWFWSPTNEKTLRTVDELMEIYYSSVGNGSLLLLNSAPDTTGLIPQKDMEIYKQFGQEIRRRFGKSLAETSGRGETVELKLESGSVIDHAIIQEDLNFGQRIRKYVIEGLTGKDWKTISQGLSVGQKRIERFQPVKVDAVRLRVVESSFPPVIRRFAVFNVSVFHTGEVKGAAIDSKPDKNVGVFNISQDGSFTFDLSPYIPLAEQYTLRIRQGKTIIRPSKIAVWLQGVETPGFAEVLEDGSIHLNITAAPDMKPNSIVIKGQLDKNYGRDALYLYVQ